MEIIDKIVDEAIDKLSNFREEFMRRFAEDENYVGLTHLEKKFMKGLELDYEERNKVKEERKV